MLDEKEHRRALILKLVADESIASQARLLDRLGKHGIKTTQATISRDIRDLGLIKVADGNGGYRYVPRRERNWAAPVAEGSVLRVESSGNLVVVHTRAGFAQPVAAALDSLGWAEILGSVGGDDTVLLVLKAVGQAGAVVARLKSLFSVGEPA